MGERLIPKLDRLGAEAGIKQMTPEIYNFALLVRADVVAQWPERPWVGLTDEEVVNLGYSADGNVCTAVRLAAVYIKEKNNGTTP
jgi:hypothetical protein